MVVYTATSGDKPSSNRDDLKHGIFTYFVLKGLGGHADGDGDRAVTVEELYRYLAEEVPAKALEPPLDREQVPEIRPPVDRLGDRMASGSWCSISLGRGSPGLTHPAGGRTQPPRSPW